MALRRDLRQVGDAQHLALAGQCAQLPANDVGDRAADTGIDFVEDHGGHGIQSQRSHFDGQRNTREFAARSHLAQGPWWLAGIGRDQEFHPFAAQRVGAFGVVGLDGDFEMATTHAQFRDQGRGGCRQLRSCRHAGPGKCLRCLAPTVGGGADFTFQAQQAFAGTLQALKFGTDGLAAFAQMFRCHAVLAGQVVEAGQLALQFQQLGRVGIQVVADLVQYHQRFIDLDVGVFQQCIHFLQARFVPCQAQQFAAGLLQLLGKRGCFVSTQAGEGGIAGVDQARGMGLATMAGGQGLDGAGVQLLALQFLELVLQIVDPVRDVTLRGQFIAFAQQGGPALGCKLHGGAFGLVAGIGIQQFQLAGPRQQGLLFVLAVDLHQQGSQFGQLGQGHAAAIDPGTRTAIGADHATQLAILVVQFVVAQPRQRRRGIVQGELG